jgi:hypothetical protein
MIPTSSHCHFLPISLSRIRRIYYESLEGEFMDAPRITVDDLKRRMGAGEDFTIIDTRNPQAWAESDTMIPEAIRFSLDEVDANVSRIPKNRAVIAYCT